MPNVKTKEMHSVMVKNLASAKEYLRQLQAQQAVIDEQISDVMRVILATQRSVAALTPALANEPVTPEQETEGRWEEDPKFMSEIEKDIAIRTAQ